MRFDGYDLIIVGLILGAGAAILFAKAYLMPSFPLETATTYLGHNPFQVRNTIVTRHEAIAGCVWLLLGLMATLVGTIRAVRANQQGYLIHAWFDILVVLAAGLVMWRLTVGVTDRTGRVEYLPVLSKMMREAFEIRSYPLYHDGRSKDEVSLGITPSQDTVERRFRDARETLDQIGKLLDEPRMPGQDDREFAKRIAVYFPGVKIE